MTEMARYWVSAVLPRVRIRQWVLSLPFALRVPLAYHHDLTLAVHGVAARVIEAFYRAKGRALGITDPRTGSITAVQRFGSDLALNVHLHILFVDGVYDALGAFTPIAAPTRAELETLCTTIAERVHKLLDRRAIEYEEPQERALCLALSRSAQRRGASKYVAEGTDPDHDGEPDWKLKARVDGFDLEAIHAVRAEDRERLEHLCRYLLRPPSPTAAYASCLPTKWPRTQEPLKGRHAMDLDDRRDLFGKALLARAAAPYQPGALPRSARGPLRAARARGACA